MVTHLSLVSTTVDDLKVKVETWGQPETVQASGWFQDSPDKIDGNLPTRHADTTTIVLMVPSDTLCKDRDKWVVDGDTYLQQGKPQDYNHGPWSASFDVPLLVTLKRSDG